MVLGIIFVIGGLCYVGIFIIYRDYVLLFYVIIGYLKGDDSGELNWNVFVNNKGIFVFLMGILNLEKISENLMKEGKDKDIFVVFISWVIRYN